MIKLPWILRKIQKVIPSTEPVSGAAGDLLERGVCYMIKEPKPMKSIEIFSLMVKGICTDCSENGTFPCESIGCEKCTLECSCKKCNKARAQGLCFTTNSPEKIRQTYHFQTTPFFWISKHGNKSINPANLEIVADMISGFLNSSKNPIILLDGIEYMILTNGFIPVFKFLNDIREKVILKNAVFILPVSPSALDEKELAMIERNMEQIGI